METGAAVPSPAACPGIFQGAERSGRVSLKPQGYLHFEDPAGDSGGRSLFLKIEGRMKRPEYTAGVTRIYRKYLDLLEERKENYKVDERDIES